MSKMRKLCELFLILCGCTSLLASAIPKEAILEALQDFQRSSPDAGDFTHQAALDEYDRYILLWKFDSETITFEAHVQTTGYIGLGFSPNGGMTGSDVIIGWVKDGQAYITDRIAEGYFQPRLDASQDVELLSGYETGTHTVLRFRRKLRPCDTVDDREITEDTMRVIWSFNDNDPLDQDGPSGPQYHFSNRGSKSIILLQKESPNLGLHDDDILSFELLNQNVLIPATDTTYWCNAVRLPALKEKHHLVKFEPVVQPGHEGLVHHILVYQCKLGKVPPLLDGGHECYQPNMPTEWNDCKSIMAAWAVGGNGFTYPDHVGFSLGTEDDPDYIVMETHYDNPDQMKGVRDSSGLRFYYTPKVRQYDAGILEVGVNPTDAQIIPPQAESFDHTGFCYCLDPYLQELGQPINVFAAMPHAHLAGTAVRTKLVRDGMFQSYLGRDESYDFDLQEIRILDPEVVVKEGDQLITGCTFKTTDRTLSTHGGLSSRQEMCMNFLQYYPRMKLDICYTMLDVNQQATFFGVHYAHWEFPFPIYYPQNLAGQTLYDVINRYPWTNEEAERFEQHVRGGKVMSYCLPEPVGGPVYDLHDPLPDPIVPDANSTSIPGC